MAYDILTPAEIVTKGDNQTAGTRQLAVHTELYSGALLEITPGTIRLPKDHKFTAYLLNGKVRVTTSNIGDVALEAGERIRIGDQESVLEATTRCLLVLASGPSTVHQYFFGLPLAQWSRPQIHPVYLSDESAKVDSPALIARAQIVPKGWGRELWIENSAAYCCKLLEVDNKKQGSVHYHKEKDELFMGFSGVILLRLYTQVGDPRYYEITVTPGVAVRIRPHTPHHYTAVNGPAAFLEFSTTHDDNDTYRLVAGDTEIDPNRTPPRFAVQAGRTPNLAQTPPQTL